MTPTVAPVGYSSTPLPRKLGLRDRQRVLFVDLPTELRDLRTSRAFAEVASSSWGSFAKDRASFDLIHGFTSSRATLEKAARPLMKSIVRDGTIWISWPKRASKVPTDITEDVIREIVLPIGLVDVKVAAVTDTWSGLKLVIRRELR